MSYQDVRKVGTKREVIREEVDSYGYHQLVLSCGHLFTRRYPLTATYRHWQWCEQCRQPAAKPAAEGGVRR